MSGPGPSTTSEVDSASGWAVDSGEIRNKMLSLWSNMKYGWTVKMKSVSFNREQPIFLLGKFYHAKAETPTAGTPVLENSTSLVMPPKEDSFELGQECDEDEEADDGFDGFKRDFISRLWFTYRRDFQVMAGSNLSTDCGWGCMLRSGQMLLAQGLLVHFLGRGWRYYVDQPEQSHEAIMHRKIISWFGDNPSYSSPFSIHQLVRMGEDTGRKAGDWYGPNAVANLLRKSHLAAKREVKDLDSFSIYVAKDCTIFIQDVLDQCLSSDVEVQSLPPWHQQANAPVPGERRTWKSLILLVPLRLGGIKFNPIYAASLKALLAMDSCLGIIGGRPKHSLFFMGFQEEKLIFLDPHYCQENVDVHEPNFSVASFHCSSPRKMRISKLDPCCCVGFYCATRMDFENFIANVEPHLIPVGNRYDLNAATGGHSMSSSLNLANYPMFVFSQGRSADQEESYFQHFYGDKEKNYQEADESLGLEDDVEIEEFVFI